MNAQSAVTRDLVSLVKTHDASIARGSEGVTEISAPLRDIPLQQAADEILILFRKKKKLYYSDIAEQLSIDLRLVIRACELLEKRGLIEGATNVAPRAKRSRR
jgi:DNA-binding MarR family transcriptional regulator